MACVFDIWVDNLMVLRDQKKFNDFFSTYFYQHHSVNSQNKRDGKCKSPVKKQRKIFFCLVTSMGLRKKY